MRKKMETLKWKPSLVGGSHSGAGEDSGLLE